MLSASWRCIIEAGEEVQVPWGCIHESWKTRRKIGCLIRQSKCCNASFAVVLKRELSKKEKLSVFMSIFVLIVIYGHKSWVMTETVRLQMLASKMRFLRKIRDDMMFDKHRNTAIQKSLDI